jgi:hypothetical protein
LEIDNNFEVNLPTYENIYDNLGIDRDDIGKDVKHGYRVILYSKIDVDFMEKRIIGEMLDKFPNNKYSSSFLLKAYSLYPEKYPSLADKKKRGKKSNNYFIEDVGKYLWTKWHDSKDYNDRNDFLTYCYQLIDGVIFKYARHKHGLAYEEIFQSAILKIIQAMDKFDPNRVVGTDDRGNPIYARVFTYFVMILNYGITTITMNYGAERITNVSYDNISRLFGNEAYLSTDAPIIFQEFLLVLEYLSNIEDDLITPLNKKIITKLLELIHIPEAGPRLANNLVFTLKNECGVKIKEVQDALELLKETFGPLIIFSQKQNVSDSIEDKE